MCEERLTQSTFWGGTPLAERCRNRGEPPRLARQGRALLRDRVEMTHFTLSRWAPRQANGSNKWKNFAPCHHTSQPAETILPSTPDSSVIPQLASRASPPRTARCVRWPRRSPGDTLPGSLSLLDAPTPARAGSARAPHSNCFAFVRIPVPQEETFETVARPAPIIHRIAPRPAQIADRFIGRFGNVKLLSVLPPATVVPVCAHRVDRF